MKVYFAVWLVLLAICLCEAKNNKNKKEKEKEKVLDGQLAESASLPLLISCPKKYKYIIIGGITLNSTVASTSQQAAATQQCDEQLANPKLQVKIPGMTTCFITFGKNVSIAQTGVIRIVYRCVTSKPSSSGEHTWIKEEKDTIYDAKLAGKKMKFSCSGVNEMIEVQQVSKAGEVVPTADLIVYRNHVLKECYKQSVQEAIKGNKQKVNCEVEYKTAKADDLKMTYKCLEAGQSTSDAIYVSA